MRHQLDFGQLFDANGLSTVRNVLASYRPDIVHVVQLIGFPRRCMVLLKFPVNNHKTVIAFSLKHLTRCDGKISTSKTF